MGSDLSEKYSHIVYMNITHQKPEKSQVCLSTMVTNMYFVGVYYRYLMNEIE